VDMSTFQQQEERTHGEDDGVKRTNGDAQISKLYVNDSIATTTVENNRHMHDAGRVCNGGILQTLLFIIL